MIVNEVTLYKTPLDKNYSNIIDIAYDVTGKKPSELYKICLDRNFNPLTVDVNGRSFRMINGEGTITLFINYLDVINYNYLCVDNKFFFITDYTSLNDNSLTPSTMLNLKWDAWANNLDFTQNSDIKNNFKSNVNTRHINRYNKDKKPIYNKNEEDINLPYVKVEKPYEQILYAKITLNKNFNNRTKIEDGVEVENYFTYKRFDNFTSSNSEITNISQGLSSTLAFSPKYMIKPLNNRYILYVPMGLNVNGRFVKCKVIVGNQLNIPYYLKSNKNIKTNVNMWVNDVSLFELPIYDTINYTFEGKDLNYVDSIEYTYNSPYTANITHNETTNEYRVAFNTPIGFLNNTDIPYFAFFKKSFLGFEYDKINALPFFSILDRIDCEYNGVNDVLFFDDEVYNENNNFSKTLTIDYTNYNNVSYNGSDFVYTQQPIEYDPKLYIYPFNYISLFIGNNEIIISPEKYDDNNYEIIITNRTNQPYLSIKCNERYINQLRELPIDNNGNVSYTLKALDDYLIRNGNQKRTSIELSKVGGILQLLSSTISGLKGSYYSSKPATYNVGGMVADMSIVALNAMSTEFKQIALEKDLSKMQDKIVGTDFAEDDLSYQDRIVIISNTCVDVDYLKSKQYNLYLYGYDINRVDYPLKNYRYWFDFVKGECYIPNIPNEIDRNIINEIFKKGVFKYHYHYSSISGNDDFDYDFKKDYSLNNIETYLARRQ